ncbi:MAG TPA: DUF1697 domain-containing protein [Isosphaeraceae bacterium]|jgi:uncharacterized protein (DUF1697 family)|nr:DUF1697 domain-containing protein [Isosphaeraceae bacterium]
MSTHLALLRGINVGGKNMLPMKDLARLFVEAGCDGVATYIRSGNVLFDAPAAVADGLPATITARIAADFGHRTPVLLRTTDELRRVVASNPFLPQGVAAETLHVYFLADLPDPARLSTLDPDRSPPDRFHVLGREVYLHLPNGMARTKLTNAYFDSKLATVSTARNWRTATTLLAMMEARPKAPAG